MVSGREKSRDKIGEDGLTVGKSYQEVLAESMKRSKAVRDARMKAAKDARAARIKSGISIAIPGVRKLK